MKIRGRTAVILFGIVLLIVGFSSYGAFSETGNMEKEAAANGADAFNFETRTVMLNSGHEMPIYGLGTYSLHDDVCRNSVTAALNRGVRLIDTAHAYGNEKEIGEAIRNSGVPREEIFVITKLYPNQFSNPETAIEEALQNLDIGYIDMLLLHHLQCYQNYHAHQLTCIFD